MEKDKNNARFIYSCSFGSSVKDGKNFGLSWGTLDDAKILLEINDVKLMNLEKKRLGIYPDKLAFIGVANLAKYYWCAWQYYIKSILSESGFFLAYFSDRLEYSKELGLLKKFPKKVMEILKIGDDLSGRDIDKIWLKRKKNYTPPDPDRKITEETIIWDKVVSRKIIDPYEITEGTNPLKRGAIYHVKKAEQYPSFRWNFMYKDIVLVGIPDGITDDFIYEFKSTSKKAYLGNTLNIANCQADIYGYFFQRPKKRVQIFCEDDGLVHTFTDNINKQRVVELLEKWSDLINGNRPLRPQVWKCTTCEYKDKCDLLKSEKKSL